MRVEAPPLPYKALAFQRRADRFIELAQGRCILHTGPDDARTLVDRELSHAADEEIESRRLDLPQRPGVCARHRLGHIADEVQGQMQARAPRPAPWRQVVPAQGQHLVFGPFRQVDGDE